MGCMGFIINSSFPLKSKMLIYQLGYGKGSLNGLNNYNNKEAYYTQKIIDKEEARDFLKDLYND